MVAVWRNAPSQQAHEIAAEDQCLVCGRQFEQLHFRELHAWMEPRAVGPEQHLVRARAVHRFLQQIEAPHS
jgi:hypothetical protein